MYELYTIDNGDRTQILRSTDDIQIREAYAILKATQAPVRISIDDTELTIHEADKWCGNDYLSRASQYSVAKHR